MITLLRRFMYRIAERIAKQNGCQCLITGESLGQVASQTIEGISSSNAVVTLPVLRPLIGFDKEEIIARSQAMGAYETSVLPFEDCCTVFLPEFPAIKPKSSYILEEEAKLDVEGLINEALATLEKITL
jgi:thiamine biosynthesis protein ThiI